MDTAQMQQILRNHGHSDARAAIEGKQSYEWERALRSCLNTSRGRAWAVGGEPFWVT
jgi:hypothetical protein